MNITERQWGHYTVLHDVPGCKVKELTVLPGKSLSMQKHNYRAEHWHVSEGNAVVHLVRPNSARRTEYLTLHDTLDINPGDWHQLTNLSDKQLKVIEIQFGKDCIEEDIERK